MSASVRSVLLLLPVVIAGAGRPPSAAAGEIVEDFSDGYNGWASQWDVAVPGHGGGETSIVGDLGYGDACSVRFDLDGSGDDGTLWIEKRFLAPRGEPADVGLSFQLYNPFQSGLNNFEVKAYLGEKDPSVQSDFTLLGETGSREGWVEFNHQTPEFVSQSGDMWAAVGIRVAWETPRTYHIDHVVVSGVSLVPEPTSLTLALPGVVMMCCASWYRRKFKTTGAISA